MNVTDYFQDFKDNGYVLFNRDPNGQLGMELAFLKLDQDFYGWYIYIYIYKQNKNKLLMTFSNDS